MGADQKMANSEPEFLPRDWDKIVGDSYYGPGYSLTFVSRSDMEDREPDDMDWWDHHGAGGLGFSSFAGVQEFCKAMAKAYLKAEAFAGYGMCGSEMVARVIAVADHFGYTRDKEEEVDTEKTGGWEWPLDLPTGEFFVGYWDCCWTGLPYGLFRNVEHNWGPEDKRVFDEWKIIGERDPELQELACPRGKPQSELHLEEVAI